MILMEKGAREMQHYDASGNGFAVGCVVQGFGLHNAGRYCTVKAISSKGILTLESHLTNGTFKDINTYWRVIE